MFFVLIELEIFTLLFALFQVRKKLKREALVFLKVTSMLLFLFTIQFLVWYLQRGWFLGVSICYIVTTTIGIYWAYFLSKLVILPVFSIDTGLQKKVHRRLIGFFILILSIWLPIFFALSYFSVTENGTIFNGLIIAHLLITPTGIGIVCIFVLRYLFLLENFIRKTNKDANRNDEYLETVNQKLSNLRKSLIQFFLGQAFGYYAVITYFVLGSVPFFWAYGMVVLLFFPVSVSLPVFSFIGTTNSSSNKGNSSTTPNSNHAVQVHNNTNGSNDADSSFASRNTKIQTSTVH